MRGPFCGGTGWLVSAYQKTRRTFEQGVLILTVDVPEVKDYFVAIESESTDSLRPNGSGSRRA